MAKKQEKILEDSELGKVVFRKTLRSRRLSIRVHPLRGITVSVPNIVPYAIAIAFFRQKREWVAATVARQKERSASIPKVSKEEIEQLRERAKRELPERLKELADRYGFKYNRVTIKHNATNWGSCSAKNNINLNLNIVRLPRVLQDYILLHELSHLRHHDHGAAFHLLLENLCTDNIIRLSDEGDELALDIAREASVSRSKYPLDSIFTREVKKYHLL